MPGTREIAQYTWEGIYKGALQSCLRIGVTMSAVCVCVIVKKTIWCIKANTEILKDLIKKEK